MEEVLIKSKQYNVKRFFKSLAILAVVSAIILYIIYNTFSYINHEHTYFCYKEEYQDEYYNDYYNYNIQECKMNCRKAKSDNIFEYTVASSLFTYYLFRNTMVLLAFILVIGLIYFWLHSYELTVTNKRIYGKVAWGKRVDLPIDSVSAIATIRILKGISISTSSGRISFCVIKNVDEIYEVINKLLMERQQGKNNSSDIATDEVELLKKYKELLDNGIITKEEFDSKKKQLLGL